MSDSMTPLFLAIRLHDDRMANILIDHKRPDRDIYMVRRINNHALILACESGNAIIAERLLIAGANPDYSNLVHVQPTYQQNIIIFTLLWCFSHNFSDSLLQVIADHRAGIRYNILANPYVDIGQLSNKIVGQFMGAERNALQVQAIRSASKDEFANGPIPSYVDIIRSLF
jgi:hypothetical protein